VSRNNPAGRCPSSRAIALAATSSSKAGLCARKESFAGFGQADAARRAQKERGTDARLECSDRLSDRRWTDAELGGRSPEVAVLGNTQECFHASALCLTVKLRFIAHRHYRE
jgi:hypothetical protein